ncbi:L,D-transpeptidase [Actinocrispum wychmicini]|uniref:Lipoprotein-anchoring transpeptidase ErfK/SrfK n=1 Tax=Actinocrispum wychmicini TaxID=1213861 RepID=A0A4R2JFL0_9PSEU|nr:L,D-transpeptidase [Actinocrispum wychmicini]TCO58533.1 lipoprotein-anchoring transpeptidase ErfK/SrfK [Actinocrispum wychmicini]
MQVRKLLIGAAVAATAVLSACSSQQQPQAIGLAAGQQNTTSAATTSTATTTSSSAAATTPQTSSATTPPPTSKTTPKTTPDKPKTTPDKPAPPPPAPSSAPCSAAASACIRLSTNESWLMNNGQVVYGPVKITSGRAGYPTPTGTFHVLSKVKDYHSREFDNAPMPYSVFFVPGIAFHQGSLGVKSHGCIHLSMAAAQKYFGTLSVGDVVEVVR